MFRFFSNFTKKIIMSSFLLYGYNLVSVKLGITVPINIITILTITVFGYSALFSFILILILIY